MSILSPSLQTKLTNGYAGVGNIEPDTSRTLHLKRPDSIPGANQECAASIQAHDQCRRELLLEHPCGQVLSLEGDRISYACGGWLPPPPLVTPLPRVLARRRSDPLGRCPEPTYVMRWPAPDTMLIHIWMPTAVRKEFTSFGTFLSILLPRVLPIISICRS